MGRTLRYFKWKKAWWLSLRFERAGSNTPPPVDVQHGLDAYACRQVNVYEGLIISFVNQWRKLLAAHRLTPGWLAKYPAAANPVPLCSSAQLSPTRTGPTTGPANHRGMNCDSPHPSSSTQPPDEDLDAPLMSEVEADDEGDDYAIDEVEEFDIDN